MKLAVLIALLFANSAYANGFDDLKAALAKMQGQSTLRGTYELKEKKTDNDKKTGPETVSASMYVEDSPEGLQMRWDRALLKRAADESKGGVSITKVLPLNVLIRSVSATRMAGTVNYAPAFLQTLAMAQLKSERVEAWQGKPARLIELVINEPDAEDAKLSVKENARLARVWIGTDGAPLAASMTRKFKAKALVFMTIEGSNKEDYVFSVMGNRLVVLKREEIGTNKGPGSDIDFHNVSTFTPKA
ncbi:hypothetical protein [Massilia glaciei]|uniref:Outer membrane lipoprotein carrier protein LolA n=1 Tax=Massilia glaciei TaxID=1524097 RepID=A0A2U2HC42_9BURK|nr:hypothetical protein [Massilia glaciei]PWF40528.1 hypothetical protein C7C56_025770 [Massilia glaciei]